MERNPLMEKVVLPKTTMKKHASSVWIQIKVWMNEMKEDFRADHEIYQVCFINVVCYVWVTKNPLVGLHLISASSH